MWPIFTSLRVVHKREMTGNRTAGDRDEILHLQGDGCGRKEAGGETGKSYSVQARLDSLFLVHNDSIRAANMTEYMTKRIYQCK